MIITDTNGITIGQLRELIKDLPEDGEIWVMTEEGLSSVAIEISNLNGPNNDVLISTV